MKKIVKTVVSLVLLLMFILLLSCIRLNCTNCSSLILLVKVTKRDYAGESEWKNWVWRSQGDLMMNGAFFVQSGSPLKKKPFSRRQLIKAKRGTYVGRLTRFSGTIACKRGKPC